MTGSFYSNSSSRIILWLMVATSASYDENNPAQFARPRRFTTREAFAVDGLTTFNAADLEFVSSEESSANEEENCEADDQVMSEPSELNDPPGPRPPVRFPPRRSLLSRRSGGAKPSFPPTRPVVVPAGFTKGPSVGRVDAVNRPHVSSVGAPANSRIYSSHGKSTRLGFIAKAEN